MENTNLKQLKVGTKESSALKPKPVKIISTEITSLTDGKKSYDKLSCIVKHPDTDADIRISTIKFEEKSGTLKVSGLWIKLDPDLLIQKGSALAHLLEFIHVDDIASLDGKDNVPTTLDEKGYLCFKAY